MQSQKIYELPLAAPRTAEHGGLSLELRQVIAERLMAAAKNGRVGCAAAMGIAGCLGVRAGDVGEVADDLCLKISRCQLGCF